MPFAPARWIAIIYIQFFMGILILIQLFMAYYGASLFGFRPDAWTVASLIGMTELARAATQINTVTFQPALVFGTVALIYFLLCWPLSLYASHLARKLGQGKTHSLSMPPLMAP